MVGMDAGMFWLLLLIVLLAIELATMGLTTIWFAGGALLAFLAAMLGCSVMVQRVVFLICSFALLILTRPVAVHYMQRKHEKTNTDSLIGKTVIVNKTIDNLAQSGEIIISGVSWTARSKEETLIFEAGSKVRICAIEGVKLIVDKIQEKEEFSC